MLRRASRILSRTSMSQPDDFVKEFLVESREGLDRLDGDLIALEENPRDLGRCDSAFRSLHTIKGNAGFLDFHRLGQLAHAGESVLQQVRAGELQIDATITDALLELLDALRRMLSQVEQTGGEGEERFESVEAKLKSLGGAQEEAESSQRESDPFMATMTFAPGDSVAGPVEDLGDEPPAQSDEPEFEATITRPVVKPEQPPAEEATPSFVAPSKPTDEGSSVVIRDSDLESAHSLASVLATPDEHGSSHAPSQASSLVRVDVHLLDRLMNLVGELVLARNQIVETFGDQTSKSTTNPVQRLNLLTSELQEGVLKTRMQRIGNLWHRYPRMVRDLARSCRKQIALDVHGDDTELDKTLLEALTDPLLHLIRNSIDHGIESPEEREAAGKPKQGRLSLRAWHQGGHVHIDVSDDGGGLNADRIRSKAIQRGLVSPEQAAVMTSDELHPLLFEAGFSTSEAITSLSGRGVGLDVVKTNIENIGGTVDIESVEGRGTTVHVTVPLTLAIVPALIIQQGGQRYAIPQVNVIELINLEGPEAVNPGELFHNAPVYRLRGEVLPLLWLSEVFGCGITPVSEDSEDGLSIAVLQAGARRFALVIDGVSGTEEIVVKPIGCVLDGLSFYTGATIMGDGQVALILDILGLARHAGLLVRKQAFAEPSLSEVIERSDSLTSLLVCQVGRRQIGVSLDEVSRLTTVARDDVELAGRSEIAQDGGGLLPLIRTHELLGEADDSQLERLPVLVHCDEENLTGLIVDRIVDIVELSPDETEHSLKETRAVVVHGKVTDLIDLKSLLSDLSTPPGSAGLESTGPAAR